MENYDRKFWGDKKCPPINCRKKQCKCGLRSVFLPAALGDDTDGSTISPKNGEYCNSIVVYEANGAAYIYGQDGVPIKVKEGNNAS